MPKPFPLIKVLEYRRHLRLDRRNALAAAMAEERELQQQHDQATQQRRHEIDELGKLLQQPGRLDVELAHQRRNLATRIEAHLVQLAQGLQNAQTKVEICRRDLVHADQEVKALERLQETFVAEQTFQMHKQAEIALAEQWQARHWAFGE